MAPVQRASSVQVPSRASSEGETEAQTDAHLCQIVQAGHGKAGVSTRAWLSLEEAGMAAAEPPSQARTHRSLREQQGPV